jgi:hypothetical protein
MTVGCSSDRSAKDYKTAEHKTASERTVLLQVTQPLSLPKSLAFTGSFGKIPGKPGLQLGQAGYPPASLAGRSQTREDFPHANS